MQENTLQTQTFWQKTKRFFSLYSKNPRYLTEQLFKWFFSWINPFIHIVFIQQLFYTFNNWSQDLFLNIFIFYILYILLYEIIDALTYNWGWYKSDPTCQKILFNEYMTHFIKLDQNAVERVWTGKIISIIEKWVDRWALSIDMLLWNGARFFVGLLFTLVYIFFQSFLLWIIVFAIYLFVIFIAIKMNSYMILYRNGRKTHEDLLTKQLVKMIMSKAEILQSSKIEKEKEIITFHTEKEKYYNLKMAPFFHSIFRVPLFGIIICKLVIIYFFAQLIFDWNIDTSYFLALFWMITLLEANIGYFIVFFKDFTKEFVTIERLWSFFDSTPQITGYEEGNTFEYKSWDIALHNISYSYSKNTPVFQNFNLKIDGGKVTALVWPSGGGKSTLVKLIAGYIRPDSWEVIIDSQKLSETSLKSYYQSVGYLTQEPSVFDGTVRENLMYGVPSHSKLHPKPRLWISSPQGEEGSNKIEDSFLLEEKIEWGFEWELDHIIKLAHCEFIYDLPNGLDTEIGERGVKLSWGQKQRLAIAKIFLKDPNIIILDEPTSALDSLSEKKITEAMHNLFKNRTVLVIAHRLQTVKHADDIIVIDSGNIIERGTHKELISRNWYYAEMLELQSGF